MSNVIRRRRKEVKPSMIFKKWKDWSEGDYITGELVSKGIDPTYGKPVYGVKLDGVSMVDPTTGNGTAIVAGLTLGLNSGGGLDYRMKEIEVGETVEIVYQGCTPLPEGHKFKGKDAHQFDVYTLGDEEDTVEEEDDCL